MIAHGIELIPSAIRLNLRIPLVVVQRLSRDVQPPFDFAHLEHLIAQKYPHPKSLT
jgi:hypothetical protein